MRERERAVKRANAAGAALIVVLLVANSAGTAWAGVLADTAENKRWEVNAAAGTADASGVAYPALDLDMAAIRSGSVTIEIDTDSPYLYIKAGLMSIKLTPGSGATSKLKLDGTAEARFEFNDQADETWQTMWRDAVRADHVKSVSLRFGACEHARVRWSVSGDGNDGTGPTTMAGAGDGVDGEAGVERMKDRVAKALAELRVARQVEGVYASGTIVLIADGGVGVTPAHLLRNARQITAHHPAVAGPLSVEVLAVDPDLDLALVQVGADDPFASRSLGVLRPAGQVPANGSAIYLAWRGGMGVELKQAEVEQTGGYTDLDEAITSAVKHHGVSRWVVVESDLAPRASGGVAITASMELAGIAGWAWGDGAHHPVLSARHVSELLDRREALPLTLGQVDAALSTALPHSIVFPRLAVDADKPPLELRRVSALLHNSYKCPLCDGKGKLSKREKVGYERTGTIRKPIYKEVEYDCTRCGGNGLNTPRVVQRMLADVGVALATADRDDATFANALDTGARALSEVADQQGGTLMPLVNAETTATMDLGAAGAGRTVAAVGELIRNIELPGKRERAYGIRLDLRQLDGARLLIPEPIYVEPRSGKLGLVIGLMAGEVQRSAREPRMPVLSHAIVIPFSNDELEKIIAERDKNLRRRR